MTGELSASSIHMRFGGVVALHETSLVVRPGRVHGLIGRNGSGKSTLFNCITGFLRPTSGEVRVDGRVVTGWAPHRLVRAGVVRTFQTPRVDLRATVRDAVLSGFYTAVESGFVVAMLGLPGARAEERRLHERAAVLMEQLGLLPLASQEIGKLSMGQVRLVEVARGLAAQARYVLLDEPAAGLTRREQALLAEQIRAVAARGIGVLLVEHNFALIRSLCDEVTVLETGRVLATGTPAEVAADRKVIDSYLGQADASTTLPAAPLAATPQREAAT
ncbi:MAG: ABC transporter ATP-binding protein [Comamonadaceae bacterium]|nr:MAG: ABC transporter ATP-binding protein [Comamonadaceae bacterium]